ncbi:MAG: NADH-quinone oxidoreductase subunit M [Proteobacteria bacterium]|nr:NADH-quinone oxidoreductase subunit M [Pseudomonadota bacterium]
MLESFSTHILSWLIALPLVGATLLYIIPSFWPESDHEGERGRVFSVVFSTAIFALSLLLLKHFDSRNPGLQFVEIYPWISSFGISYAVGLDGISLWLVLLATFLMPIIFVASASVHAKRRGYLASMFVLQSAMLGTLVSTDLFLFYVFWELMLAPMYFIIGIWGGSRRVYATLKFVLYTVFGSVLMLVAILFVVWRYYDQTHALTFDLHTLLESTNLTLKEELWLFSAFALAFGIKVPIFPFHTWLPDAHVEAPTGGSVVLAGVLLKMGIYGFLRFAYPLFPRGAEYFGVYLAGLAAVGIVYGALVAWAQTDIKKLVAYSSVSHLGYCVLGLVAFNSVSTAGSIYQMLNHGISTGALFLLVGVLYDRRHTRLISEYGGLASKVPVFAFLFLVFTLSSIALPLTNGFIGEFMILAGSFKSFPWLTVIAGTGVILGAVYMLTLYMKTMFGELDISKNGELTDVNFREFSTFVPLLVMVFFMGLYPQPFLDRMEPTINNYIASVQARSERLQENESAIPGDGATRTEAASMASVQVSKEVSLEQRL